MFFGAPRLVAHNTAYTCVLCDILLVVSYAQTLFLVAPDDSASTKAVYRMPSLGTPTDFHVVLNLAGEARESLGDGNPALTLGNVRGIVEMIESTDDDTRRKLAKGFEMLSGTITEVFASAADIIAKGDDGKFTVADAGGAAGGISDDSIAATDVFVRGYIERHGTDHAAIAAAINSSLEGKLASA